ncbi:uncharacterized protein LOC127798241 isoform X2 [Diospyros lotus]|nr:uncharacterized protein LOC127798241 isoform X2 [Diospyros lotus]
MTGNKVIQTIPENMKDQDIDWVPVRDGFQVRLRAFGGTYLRANGGMPPWKNSVTHDNPHIGSTQKWVAWDIEIVESPENLSSVDSVSMVSSFSDDLYGPSAPVSPAYSINPSPTLSLSKNLQTGMDFFRNAKAVRLRSRHDKYLHAHDDEDTVVQDRDGVSPNARWSVEFIGDAFLRLRSCYGKYLTASNVPFLLGMTGRKVLQTLPSGRLDSSLEWEPVREGNHVKLRTHYGHFLRANGGLPPWRNSVTHDIPHRTTTQDWILWDVDVVEIVVQSPRPKLPVQMPPVQPVQHVDSFASESSAPSVYSSKSASFGRQESSDSLVSSPPKAMDGRTIYYNVSDDYGNVEQNLEGLNITFKGNNVDELTRVLEDETGLEDVIVCSRNPLNGKLYPLRLQLPPNSTTMHVVLVRASSKLARDFAEMGISL